MSFSTLKPPASRIPPVVGANGFPSEASRVVVSVNKQPLPALQTKQIEQPLLLQSTPSTSSRREMMHSTAASLFSLALLFPALAEARPRDPTMKQKIMEKFKQLKEKAGLSKPEDESEKEKSKGKDESRKQKPSSDTNGDHLKSKQDDDEKKNGKEYPAKAAEKEELSLPTLPNLSFPIF